MHLINWCISSQTVWIVSGGTDFPFLFFFSFFGGGVVVVFLILDGLQFLKHAAFEEGMANQRGLTLLWSNSKGFPRLTTTAPCLRQCQNTKQAWPPTFLSPALTIHTCHRTVTLSCFQGLIYCYLKNNPSIKCIRLRICELNGLILLTGKTKVRLRLVYFNYLLSRHERHLTHREQPLLKVYPPKSQKILTTLEVKCSFACYRRSGIKKIWNKMFF